MRIDDILTRDKTLFSFEFFPPKTDNGWSALSARLAAFEALEPSFVSVTYGAGGSTRDKTNALVKHLAAETSLDPIPHLTCVGHSKKDIGELLTGYAEVGIDNLLALRGDKPQEGIADSDFSYGADLVKHIKSFNGRAFGVGVAGYPEGHPETPNRLTQMEHLKAKVDAGADWICTQLFFDNNAFYDWKERCELSGINAPILAGIMPITSIANMKSMAELAGGTNFPAALQRRLMRCQDDPDAVRNVGISWAAEQCADLLDHDVREIHFFTMNQSSATEDIYKSLGVTSSSKLR